ncbi:MAG: hydrogenase maturation peptidase HycI [Candidatus Freyarchaeota archaeon]
MTYDQLEDTLKKFLNNPAKIVLLGVGSEFHGDDYVGVIICKRLKNRVPENVSIIEAGVSPENFTGKLRRINPSHIILIDAADMCSAPGSVRIINSSDIGGLPISTHHLPLSMFINYLEESTNSSVIFIGIQPKSTNFGESLSSELERVAQNLSHVLKKVFREIFTNLTPENNSKQF